MYVIFIRFFYALSAILNIRKFLRKRNGIDISRGIRESLIKFLVGLVCKDLTNLECENPRQPYMELAVSLSAFWRMSYCICCSGERPGSLSSALTARRDSTSFLISAGSTPGGASPEGSSGMKSSSWTI